MNDPRTILSTRIRGAACAWFASSLVAKTQDDSEHHALVGARLTEVASLVSGGASVDTVIDAFNDLSDAARETAVHATDPEDWHQFGILTLERII